MLLVTDLKFDTLGQVPGFPHLSTGQEAVAVGVCANLTPTDYLCSGHRAQGHILAKDSDSYATFADFLGLLVRILEGGEWLPA